ncbi:MAG: prenyltransferase/squalene oxidase repeat-containing protein [Gemmataceae bacterium]
MKRTGLAVVLVLCMAAVLPAAEDGEKSERVDKAIDKALEYLSNHQNEDGSWNSAQGPKNAAITGLSVMAFLSAGHVPGEGKYGDTIKKGVEWVLKQQQTNGLIATQRHYEMYQHGICTLMLAEVAGMTDGKLGEEIRTKLARAIDIILKAQRPQNQGEARGGWRYLVEHVRGSDISVTGWQIMALRAAKNLGCDVPPEAIEKAVAYIKRSQDPNTGAFRYAVHEGSRTTIACTGTSILALELCGKEMHRSEELLRAGGYLLKHNPPWGYEQISYSMYYCSQACFQLGGNYWNHFKPLMHKHLLGAQESSGAWKGDQAEERSFGRHYSTSMAVLALTVEYRFLPIYQRSEEADEKAKP